MMSNQLPGSVGESQPLTLPGNYHRVHSGSFTISGSVQVPFGIHSGSFTISEFIQDPFRISGSIQDPFGISGSIQDSFRI